MSAASKPVQLQFNQRGAWRNAINFDASNAEQASYVMQHASDLARVSNARARIVTSDGAQHCIAGWTAEKGWYDFATGKPL